MKQEKKKIRLCVIGGPRVGKSAFTVRYLTKRFIGEYQSEIDMIYHQNISGSNNIELILVDMVAPTSFISDSESQSLTSGMNMIGAGTVTKTTVSKWDAIILIYSITDRNSFADASQILTTLAATASNMNDLPPHSILPVPILLIGNKSDLEHLRTVGKDEGMVLANHYKIQHFSELSVAEDIVEVTTTLNTFISEHLLKDMTYSKQNGFNTTTRRKLFSVSRMFMRIGKRIKLRSSESNSSCSSSDTGSIDESSFPQPFTTIK